MTRCLACPMPAASPCKGESRLAHHYCQLATSPNPIHRAAILGGNAIAHEPRQRRSQPCESPGEAAPAPTRSRFDAALTRAMNRCPHRTKTGCGCAWPWTCTAAYGAEVRSEDCRRCLRARGAVDDASRGKTGENSEEEQPARSPLTARPDPSPEPDQPAPLD